MPRNTSRRVLEFQCDRIEAVLAQHKVTAHVTGGLVTPRWVRFRILPAVGAKVSKIRGLAEELAMALNSDTCRISRRGAIVAVEIPRADPRVLRLVPLQQHLQREGSIPFGTAVLGLAEDGVPLMVRLHAPEVSHLLIAGTTGSGKTALAQTIVASLALSHRPRQMGFVLIDPKRGAFGPLECLPHLLRPVISEPEDAARILRALVQLMLMRDSQGRSVVSDRLPGDPRVVIVIDELADLMLTLGTECARAVTRLAQRGREAGIHLIACTQKPASQVMGGLAKANFPLRLVGRVTSPEDAKVASGYARTGAERLRGPGDFVAVTGGLVTRFQAAWVSTQEMAAICTAGGDRELSNVRKKGRLVAPAAHGAHSCADAKQVVRGAAPRRSVEPAIE